MLERGSQKKTMKRLEVTKAFEKKGAKKYHEWNIDTDQILTSYFNYPHNYLIGKKPIIFNPERNQ